jgi:hypothetical protein
MGDLLVPDDAAMFDELDPGAADSPSRVIWMDPDSGSNLAFKTLTLILTCRSMQPLTTSNGSPTVSGMLAIGAAAAATTRPVKAARCMTREPYKPRARPKPVD